MGDKTTGDAAAEADGMGPCPQCGGRNTVVPLGDRIDHPHRWLRWAITITRIYVCQQCGAVTEVIEIRHPPKK